MKRRRQQDRGKEIWAFAIPGRYGVVIPSKHLSGMIHHEVASDHETINGQLVLGEEVKFAAEGR